MKLGKSELAKLGIIVTDQTVSAEMSAEGPYLKYPLVFIEYLLLIALTTLSGCGGCQRGWTHFTGNLTEKCHKGVTYVQSDSGIALLVDKDGKPVVCE